MGLIRTEPPEQVMQPWLGQQQILLVPKMADVFLLLSKQEPSLTLGIQKHLLGIPLVSSRTTTGLQLSFRLLLLVSPTSNIWAMVSSTTAVRLVGIMFVVLGRLNYLAKIYL